MKRYDPCLCCDLPDCDESSRHCGLKKAVRQLKYARRHGIAPTAAMVTGKALYNAAAHVRLSAEKSEARP